MGLYYRQDGLATVGRLSLTLPLNEMTPREREKVATCLFEIAGDVSKDEAKGKEFLISIYQDAH